MRHFVAAIVGGVIALPACAAPFYFSTGDPDGLMGMASRPADGALIEIEAADDFITTSPTTVTGATFTGLFVGGATIPDIASIGVEIYRVFPLDSQNPPSGDVPTRVNSPSDVAFDSRVPSFTCGVLNSSFTVTNSVVNGINPSPSQTTGGEGAQTGQEVQCTLTFATPFTLAADHYFFVPQVGLDSGAFLWLSAPKPITGGSGAFAPDLQTWIRNANLDPDWLRVGTDIVGGSPAPTFNAAFSLTGVAESAAVPEPGDVALLLAASGAGMMSLRRRAVRRDVGGGDACRPPAGTWRAIPRR